ncbi:Rad9-domain-containing protein [Mycena amicta]|nr:Rad9-domain-containing protein [Mycena amicta]
MQATLDASALKPFTRALACLSRYGDDLAIYATQDGLSLSTTNSSKSAYSRFKYTRQFFSKYSVGVSDAWARDDEDEVAVTGQLLTKSLLSILRHKTIEKSVEKCELSIVEGTGASEPRADDQDGLESRLIVRLHCKHGVIKTHRLLLLTLTSFLAPGVPDAYNESHLTVGPRAIKDMIEHFPVPKGARSDPQLIWNFGEAEVEVKSYESSLESKGRFELSTELKISAEEFDLYDVYAAPIIIAFHLREFNATIAFAESMSLPLGLRFTDPAAPLFIDVEGDNSEALFVISTSQVPGAPGPSQVSTNSRKREREETPRDSTRIRKSMKAAQRTDAASIAHSEAERAARSQSTTRTGLSGSMPPPPTPRRTSSRNTGMEMVDVQRTPSVGEKEPLFLPASSQMSQAEVEVLRETGLGIEDMSVAELHMMLDGEGDEVMSRYGSPEPPDRAEQMEFAATQSSDDHSRFQPLFED